MKFNFHKWNRKRAKRARQSQEQVRRLMENPFYRAIARRYVELRGLK